MLSDGSTTSTISPPSPNQTDGLIHMSCPTCRRSLTYPAGMKGDRRKCPACGTPVTVDPAQTVAAPPPQPGAADAGLAAMRAEAGAQECPPGGPTEANGFFDRGVGFETRCLDAGILGGAALLRAAIVWFVIGWWCGYIFFYPPILAVLGIVAILRSVLGGDSLT